MMPFPAGKPRAGSSSAAERLAQENEQMERRLKQLKAAMRKKKEQRPNPGVIWRSGARGAIKQHVVNLLDQNAEWRASKPGRKVKVLKTKNSQGQADGNASLMSPSKTSQKGRTDLDLLPGPQDEPTSMPHIESRTLGAAGTSTPSSISTLNPRDDEFDEQASHASFLEALTEWRNGGGSSGQIEAGSTGSTREDDKVNSGSGSGSLLAGPAYDEKANAIDFQRAVMEWRNAGSVNTEDRHDHNSETVEKSVEVSSGSAQTEPASTKHPVVIKFSSNLSYMERLMLSQARKNPPSRPQSAVLSAATGEQSVDIDSSKPHFDMKDNSSNVHEESQNVTIQGIDVCEGVDIEEITLPDVIEEPKDLRTCDLDIGATQDTTKNNRVVGWSHLTVTPEYSSDAVTPSPVPGDSLVKNSAPNGHDDSVCLMTPSMSDSEELLAQAIDTKLSIQGMDIERITPSLMNDFEEMEKSFTE